MMLPAKLKFPEESWPKYKEILGLKKYFISPNIGKVCTRNVVNGLKKQYFQV